MHLDYYYLTNKNSSRAYNNICTPDFSIPDNPILICFLLSKLACATLGTKKKSPAGIREDKTVFV